MSKFVLKQALESIESIHHQIDKKFTEIEKNIDQLIVHRYHSRKIEFLINITLLMYFLRVVRFINLTKYILIG